MINYLGNYLGYPSLENNFKNEPVINYLGINYLGHPSLEKKATT